MLRYPLRFSLLFAIGTASIRRGKEHDPVHNPVYRNLRRLAITISPWHQNPIWMSGLLSRRPKTTYPNSRPRSKVLEIFLWLGNEVRTDSVPLCPAKSALIQRQGPDPLASCREDGVADRG